MKRINTLGTDHFCLVSLWRQVQRSGSHRTYNQLNNLQQGKCNQFLILVTLVILRRKGIEEYVREERATWYYVARF